MKTTLIALLALGLCLPLGCGKKKESPASKGDDKIAKLVAENGKLKAENEKLKAETEAARLEAENAQLKAENARLRATPGTGSNPDATKEIRKILGWCLAINLGVLLAWFLVFVFARDFLFRIHTRWFKIPEERFDEIHYIMMGCCELFVFVFNVVPYLALHIVK